MLCIVSIWNAGLGKRTLEFDTSITINITTDAVWVVKGAIAPTLGLEIYSLKRIIILKRQIKTTK